ncbi:hypothetical protein BurJ1DRAFT_0118 [Burkholderiales bacterium JOSHI_001]|nr:hypothetical protein BurJ1DRAFT_0118 [Burkholderiales bacterium JOSHI_001]
MNTSSLRRHLLTLGLSLALAAAPLGRSAWAHDALSDASVLSALPVAVSVAAPALLLSGGVALTVVAVQASATGTVWVLERASDGARVSVNFAGQAVASVGAGVVVLALSTGWVLSAAGQALCFIPNEIGASLLHNEQVTR